MKARRSTLPAGVLSALTIMLIAATTVSAATFSLAWDPNCNGDPTLIGYNIYYSAGVSVRTNPESAKIVYIPLDSRDFNPDQPAYEVTGLQNDVKYFFIVTAVYKDGESDMSNEISGTRSTEVANPSDTSSESKTATTSAESVTDSSTAADTTTPTATSSTNSTTSRTQQPDEPSAPTLKVIKVK